MRTRCADGSWICFYGKTVEKKEKWKTIVPFLITSIDVSPQGIYVATKKAIFVLHEQNGEISTSTFATNLDISHLFVCRGNIFIVEKNYFYFSEFLWYEDEDEKFLLSFTPSCMSVTPTYIVFGTRQGHVHLYQGMIKKTYKNITGLNAEIVSISHNHSFIVGLDIHLNLFVIGDKVHIIHADRFLLFTHVQVQFSSDQQRVQVFCDKNQPLEYDLDRTLVSRMAVLLAQNAHADVIKRYIMPRQPTIFFSCFESWSDQRV